MRTKRRLLDPGKWFPTLLIFILTSGIIHFLFVYNPEKFTIDQLWSAHHIISSLGLGLLTLGIISEMTTLVSLDFYESWDDGVRFAHYGGIITFKVTLFLIGVSLLATGFFLSPESESGVVKTLFQDVRLGAGLVTSMILLFQITRSIWRLLADQDDFLEIGHSGIRWFDKQAGTIRECLAADIRSIHLIYEDSPDSPDLQRLVLQGDRFSQEIDLERLSLLPHGRKILIELDRFFADITEHIATKPQEEALSEEFRFGIMNVMVVVLSLYVLIALMVQSLVPISQETSDLLDYIDHFICGFFLIEFFVRFFRADNKLKFLKWGWIDFISSIPMVDFVRAGRLLRLIRILRVIRAFTSTRHLLNHLFANRAQGAFTSLSVLAILMVIFSAIAILQVETEPESNIRTAEDAIWWAYVTITTVGYGDKYPVTMEGRIIAAFLMTVGVGLFGTFTAFVSSWFVGDKGEKKPDSAGSKDSKF